MKNFKTYLSRYWSIALIALLVLAFSVPFAFQATDVSAHDGGHGEKTDAQTAFRNDMRRLWEDHVFWTRLYIISAAHDLPDKDATAQRLLKNQEDIGNAVRAYYGDKAADQLTALLKEHILGAAALLDAAKSGDQAKIDAASKAWYQNADDIARFLNKANPKYWPLATLQEAMKMHLDETLQEAVNRLQGNYAADIQDFEGIENHIIEMADLLSSGIIRQFPDKFKER